MRRRLTGLLGSLLTISLLSSGCGGAPSKQPNKGASKSYAKDGTFTIALEDDLGGFDPYQSPIFGTAFIAYDPMVHLRPDGKFVPGLAEKWTVDANSATFTLRPGVTCSDGSPLTASTVAADIAYVGDPKNKSVLFGGYVPDIPHKVTSDDASRTVKIVFEKPFSFLLNTVGQLPIVCAKGMENRQLLSSSSSGTGPFVLTNVVRGQSYTFAVRNGYTWGPDGAGTSAPGTPAKLVIRIVTSATTRANLLLSGAVNMAPVTSDDRQRLDAQGLKKFELPISGNWLWFNQRATRPTADKRVRQALVQALDLNELVKVGTGGLGGPATGVVSVKPNPCPGNNLSGRLPKYDSSAADRLLDEAGWIKGADGVRRKGGGKLTIDLHYVPIASDYDKPMAELLGKRWESIGVKVKLTANTWLSADKDMFQRGNFDVYTIGFGLNQPSQAMRYLSGPTPPDGRNFTGIQNKDYDSLVAKALTMPAPESCTYWNQAEQVIYRDVNMVPVSDRPIPYYLHKAEAATTGQYTPAIPTSLRVLN